MQAVTLTTCWQLAWLSETDPVGGALMSSGAAVSTKTAFDISPSFRAPLDDLGLSGFLWAGR